MEKKLTHYLKCKICGNIIETLPVQCGYSINLNEESGEWECDMGPKLGIMKLNELICSKCILMECYP